MLENNSDFAGSTTPLSIPTLAYAHLCRFVLLFPTTLWRLDEID